MHILKPVFYDAFSCVGSACPFTCCGGWCITIDEKTRKSYRKMGGQIAKFAKKKVIYSEQSHSNIVDLRESQGVCPLLNEQQLCEAVLQKGPEALSRTCRLYPRRRLSSFDTQEEYLTLGCPRVVQLLLEVQGKLTFILQPDENMNTDNIPICNDMLMINLKVRETVADFLQHDEIPFWFREFYGAYTIEKIGVQIEEKNLPEVVRKLEQLYTPSFYLAIFDSVKDNKNREQQFQSLCGLINGLEDVVAGALFPDFYGYSKVIEKMILCNRMCTFEAWDHARERWLVKKNDLHRENIFVYNWMLGAFTTGNENELLQNYMACVLIDVLANHLLILYEIEEEVREELVEVIICFLVRVFLHGNQHVKDIVKAGMDKKILAPAFLIYLCDI
ncbi:MAG: flagellin lysine-N-methylase [Lachnospiraceae bacterium]|nr:flagellin lysine-N-methylase [Lachnospiraceae bacterium]